MRALVRTGVLTALGHEPLRALAVRAAARRGHALVLVYHRLQRSHTEPAGVVPTISPDHFARHLDVLTDLGRLVALDQLAEGERDPRRPTFAVTFDDDYASHTDLALPLLVDHDVTATFFVGGRGLHDLPPLWFEQLDDAVASRGVTAVARDLDVSAETASVLAERVEADTVLQARLTTGPTARDAHLGAADLARLTAAGMTVGFHTLHHPVLTTLDDAALAYALDDGRDALRRACGSAVDVLAYPHGKADARVARAARTAGYRAACTGRPAPARPTTDPMLIGRWEPGPLDVDAFAATLLLRLHRASPA